MNTLTDHFRRMKEEFDEGRRWIQGEAESPDGRCLIGQDAWVTRHTLRDDINTLDPDKIQRAYESLTHGTKWVMRTALGKPAMDDSVVAFNDAFRRTWEEIDAFLERCISIAEQIENPKPLTVPQDWTLEQDEAEQQWEAIPA